MWPARRSPLSFAAAATSEMDSTASYLWLKATEWLGIWVLSLLSFRRRNLFPRKEQVLVCQKSLQQAEGQHVEPPVSFARKSRTMPDHFQAGAAQELARRSPRKEPEMGPVEYAGFRIAPVVPKYQIRQDRDM